jgi:hypothetical protein
MIYILAPNRKWAGKGANYLRILSGDWTYLATLEHATKLEIPCTAGGLPHRFFSIRAPKSWDLRAASSLNQIQTMINIRSELARRDIFPKEIELE